MSRETTRMEFTEYGPVEFETVECGGCGQEVPKSNTDDFSLTVRKENHIDSTLSVTACEYCQENSDNDVVGIWRERTQDRIRRHNEEGVNWEASVMVCLFIAAVLVGIIIGMTVAV